MGIGVKIESAKSAKSAGKETKYIEDMKQYIAPSSLVSSVENRYAICEASPAATSIVINNSGAQIIETE